MKLLITEQQIKKIISQYITEDIDNEYDWFEFHDENCRDIFSSILNKQKITFSNKINPMQYKSALEDFVRYNGMFNRFPVKFIYRWKGVMLENTAMLDNLTALHGHTDHFPFDEFYDVFNYTESQNSGQYNLFTGETEVETPDGEFTKWCKQRYKETKDKDYLKEYDWNSAYEYLDTVCNLDDYIPFFTNGQPVLSDFGLRPLTELCMVLIKQEKPEDIIVTINKMLDVVHPRSDLAELFIIGGSKSLDVVAGFEKEERY